MRGREVAYAAGAGLAAFAAQWASVTLWVPTIQVSTVWLPGGLLLALAILTPARQWWTVLGAGAAGMVALLQLRHYAAFPALAFAGALTGGYSAALAAAIRALLKRSLELSTLREYLAYLGVVVLGGTTIASLLFLGTTWGF